MIRRHVIVTGRVQGVWYRQGCQHAALGAGVTGWVRNNDDGNVEAVLEGDAEAVDQVLAWMQVGPPHAMVLRVEHTAEAPRGEHGFTIR
jgi:acylphosphatase